MDAVRAVRATGEAAYEAGSEAGALERQVEFVGVVVGVPAPGAHERAS